MRKKINNSVENKAKVSFILGVIMGDMLKSVEPQEKYDVLTKYRLNLEESTNEEIISLIKKILSDFPKYHNRDLNDIFKELNLTEEFLILLEN